MKNIFTLILFCFGIVFISAQQKNLESFKQRIDNSRNVAEFDEIYNELVPLRKVQGAEQWKAYYLSAYTQYTKSSFQLRNDSIYEAQTSNDIALKNILVAKNKAKANADVAKLAKMIEDHQKTISQLSLDKSLTKKQKP